MGNTPTIDYDKLASQNGAVTPQTDYDALAQQHGAIGSSPNLSYSNTPLEQQKYYGAQQFAGDLAKGFSNAQLQTIAGAGSLANKIIRSPWLANEVARLQQAAVQQNAAQKIGGFGENVGEMLAGGEGLKALGVAGEGAGALSNVGSQAVLGAASSGAHGGSPVTGALVGAGAEGAAQGLQALAPSMAETSLGIGNKARAFGKTPGVAAINDTSGLRPEAVSDSAGQAIDSNARQLEQLYANANKPVSMKPALDVLSDARMVAAKQNNKDAIQAIDDIRSRLMKNAVTGKNMGVLRSASDALALKRGIGESANWNPNIQTKGTASLMKRVYAAIDGELDRVVPEGEDLNQKISSLIEVRNRADIESRNAGLVQNVAHRFAAHTGALTMGAAGGYEGYKQGGPEGAIIGGLAGVVGPELLANPTAQMLAARGMNVAPQIIRPVAVPLANAAQPYIPINAMTLSTLGGH